MSTRLAGHGLRREGKPYCAAGCKDCPFLSAVGDYDGHGVVSNNGHGHGLCACGQSSKHLQSNADRKRWHVQHKEEVRERGNG
jgi:hypothetical protein